MTLCMTCNTKESEIEIVRSPKPGDYELDDGRIVEIKKGNTYCSDCWGLFQELQDVFPYAYWFDFADADGVIHSQ